MSELIVKPFFEPPLGNNNYVVIEPLSHEAFLVDCSAPDEKIMTYIQDQGAELKFILLTHVHFDHISGLSYFQEKYGIKAFMSAPDLKIYSKMNEWMQQNGLPALDVPKIDSYLDEKSVLQIGPHPIRVFKTPGHTVEGVSYLVDKCLFSGDTLFKGTYGRTDTPGGDLKQIQNSIQMLLKLPEDTIVYPGHGRSTTIGAEKKWYL